MEEPKRSRTDKDKFDVFIALRVPGKTGCHITISTAKNVEWEYAKRMEVSWNSRYAAYTEIPVMIGNFCLLGDNGQVPAYRCKFRDGNYKEQFRAFHREFYVPAPGKRMYPELDPHITVDNDARLAEIEAIIIDKHGFFDVNFTEAIVEIVARPGESTFDAHTWTCGVCHNRNPIMVKECLGLIDNDNQTFQTKSCTQWRPKEAIPAPPPFQDRKYVAASTPNDWICHFCGIGNNFSRGWCRGCSRPMLNDKGSDWNCTRCGDLQFARNTECRKCGSPK